MSGGDKQDEVPQRLTGKTHYDHKAVYNTSRHDVQNLAIVSSSIS